MQMRITSVFVDISSAASSILRRYKPQTTTAFTIKQSNPIGAIRRANALHVQPEDWPMSMFCGFPVSVIIEPTLLLVASQQIRFGGQTHSLCSSQQYGVIDKQSIVYKERRQATRGCTHKPQKTERAFAASEKAARQGIQ